jgi:hypothetical protein
MVVSETTCGAHGAGLSEFELIPKPSGRELFYDGMEGIDTLDDY